MKTAMQDLKEDLQETKITVVEMLKGLNDKQIMETVNEYVQATLDSVIERLDIELLEKEKQQIIEAHEKGLSSMNFQTADFKSGNKYYNQKFES